MLYYLTYNVKIFQKYTSIFPLLSLIYFCHICYLSTIYFCCFCFQWSAIFKDEFLKCAHLIFISSVLHSYCRSDFHLFIFFLLFKELSLIYLIVNITWQQILSGNCFPEKVLISHLFLKVFFPWLNRILGWQVSFSTRWFSGFDGFSCEVWGIFLSLFLYM